MDYHVKTHSDLDGAGCRLVLQLAGFPIRSTTYHTYQNIDDAILSFFLRHLEEFPNREVTLFITDICPTLETCAKVDKLVKINDSLNVQLYDHHVTRKKASKYSWATVNTATSATEILWERYSERISWKLGEFQQLVSAISAWDMWKMDSPFRQRGEKLNSLLGFIGKEDFVSRFSEDPFSDKKEPFLSICKYLEKRKENYVRKVIKDQLFDTPYHMDGLGNTFKIIFATDYISDLAYAALDHPEFEDLHYICVVNPLSNSCSLRSRQEDNVNVEQVARKLNGGGHPKAAGFPFRVLPGVEREVFKVLNSLEY